MEEYGEVVTGGMGGVRGSTTESSEKGNRAVKMGGKGGREEEGLKSKGVTRWIL